MKLSMTLNYSGDPRAAAEDAADLERAGVDVGWVAELYSFDAVSILGYLAAKTETMELGSAILPIYSRTPTLTAMTAAGLDAVSDGRFILGIGASGPQVIEGWHGLPYDKPIGRQKEIIEICRKVWAREVVTHDGPSYQLPLPEDQGTGLGKPLKLINHPKRADIPIYIASLGPKNVEVTAEMADGWIPVFFHPDKANDVWGDALAKGAANRDPSLPPMSIVAGGTVAICDEDQAKKIRDGGRFMTALYVGGMGAKGKNFYNNIFRKYGYEEEAEKIQDLYLDGKKEEAMAAVPQDFLDATAMVGDEGYVRERIEAYQAAGVTHLSIQPAGADRLGLIEKVKGWIS
ncbi:MAG: LLM class F420-dependent oxidoreductase [Acidimicrobiales bacterium]|nr:MAG: LLM class F420-dependent oxidoreductase [Acidimicrobiales bacterium]